MLVIVHQHQAVGVARKVGQIPGCIAYRRIDIKPLMVRMKIRIERRDQRLVALHRVQRDLLEVQRQPAIARIRRQKAVRLIHEVCPRIVTR